MGTNGFPEIYYLSNSYQPRELQGEGTREYPFQIWDKYDLIAVNQDPFANYILMSNIDIATINFNTAVIYQFSGSFNGSSFELINLSISGGSHLGLFGSLNNGGNIENLIIKDSEISGNSNIGSLVAENFGIIKNCKSNGTISGVSSLGGLIGDNYLIVSNSYADTNVSSIADTTGSTGTSGHSVGGLVGTNIGTVKSCYAMGDVYGESSVGGLIGRNSNLVKNSYSIGHVDGNLLYGGLCGSDSSIILNCYWDTISSGISNSAGGYPKSTGEMKIASTFVGWNDGDWKINEGLDYPCLIWEELSGSVIDTDYPNATYSGEGTCGSPFVINTADDLICISQRVFDWDKYTVLSNDIDMVGRLYFPPVYFNGIFNGNNFEIRNLSIHSISIGNSSQIGLFKVLNGSVRNLGLVDVNIEGGSSVGSLAGRCDGNITECYAEGTVSGMSTVGGLVGNNNGTIKNSHADTNVTNTGSNTGGLVGYNDGTIIGCHATGNVAGGDYVTGGLSGYNMQGTIMSCYATGDVFGQDWIGGLVGMNNTSVLIECYAKGGVNGRSKVGGLVGFNSRGKIANCYSTGKPTGTSDVGGLSGSKSTGGVYEDTSNYWDVQTSEIFTSAMGTGKPSYQMKEIDTFLNAGWDFLGESTNGHNYIWRMCVDGIDYPHLSWEYAQMGDFACGDGTDILDLQALAEHWLLTEALNATTFSYACDANRDGVIDLIDFSVLGVNWGN